MATIITHAIVGAGLASLPVQTVPRVKLMITLALVAMLPDADVIGFHFGIAYGDVLGHRGFTHSVIFALGIGLLVPPLIFRNERDSWLIGVLTFISTVSHGLLDALTDAGLGIGFLIPFDETRYFAAWRPIETSPLGISQFFGARGVSILRNESFYLLLPYLTFIGSLWLLRLTLARLKNHQ